MFAALPAPIVTLKPQGKAHAQTTLAIHCNLLAAKGDKEQLTTNQDWGTLTIRTALGDFAPLQPNCRLIYF